MSTSQLQELFGEDLWASRRPGGEERFALWLEILLESGEDLVAERLLRLPEAPVTLGLQRQLLVLDMDVLAVEMSERHRDVDLVEKALERWPT